jgi:endonuclease YncB( thermonuclease family)
LVDEQRGLPSAPAPGRAILCLIVLALTPTAALADFTGRVVKVSDGDTITVLVHKTQIRVRLDAIDAPEFKQAFGQRSRQSLADICAGRTAEVVERGKDRYGRTIGKISCDGVDANSEQLRRGMAWVFTRYVPKGSPLYELEANARLRQTGLWADAHPVAPWVWRAAQRAAQKPQPATR